MAAIERLTIILPTNIAAVGKGAVEGGDHASSSEAVREALYDCKMKRALRPFPFSVPLGKVSPLPCNRMNERPLRAGQRRARMAVLCHPANVCNE